jgi:septal ring factor EnvC (AmiA/AmiB activator)
MEQLKDPKTIAIAGVALYLGYLTHQFAQLKDDLKKVVEKIVDVDNKVNTLSVATATLSSTKTAMEEVTKTLKEDLEDIKYDLEDQMDAQQSFVEHFNSTAETKYDAGKSNNNSKRSAKSEAEKPKRRRN